MGLSKKMGSWMNRHPARFLASVVILPPLMSYSIYKGVNLDDFIEGRTERPEAIRNIYDSNDLEGELNRMDPSGLSRKYVELRRTARSGSEEFVNPSYRGYGADSMGECGDGNDVLNYDMVDELRNLDKDDSVKDCADDIVKLEDTFKEYNSKIETRKVLSGVGLYFLTAFGYLGSVCYLAMKGDLPKKDS